MKRRGFFKALLGGVSALAISWKSDPPDLKEGGLADFKRQSKEKSECLIHGRDRLRMPGESGIIILEAGEDFFPFLSPALDEFDRIIAENKRSPCRADVKKHGIVTLTSKMDKSDD